VEPPDFKNVIVENIPPALFEDAEVTEVKQPRNSKQRKFYYETSAASEAAQWILFKTTFLKSVASTNQNEL
jgi:hypothetical protein